MKKNKRAAFSIGWEVLVWIILAIIGIFIAAVVIHTFLKGGSGALDGFKLF
jgi:hypothetical protein